MIFRNATLFRLTPSAAAFIDAAMLGHRLQSNCLAPVGGLAIESIGWVSPFGPTDPELFVRCGRFFGLTLGSETRVLPGSVVNKAVFDRVQALEAMAGRRVGGRERKRLRDEVLADLIPRAFVQPGRLDCYLDLQDGWLVVDTASRKAAERVVTHLRETFDTMPGEFPDPMESVRSLMTGWLVGAAHPDGFQLGDTAVLRDPADSGATARLRGQDLESDEVGEHLRSGKQCTDLGLIVDGRVALRLDEAMTLRGIRILDIDDQLESTERDSPRSEVDARFALFTLIFSNVLSRLAETFRWEQPRDRGVAA